MLPSASNIFPVLLLVGVNHLQRADQKVTSLMKPFLILPPKTWLGSYYSFHSTQTPSIHPNCIDTLLTLGFLHIVGTPHILRDCLFQLTFSSYSLNVCFSGFHPFQGTESWFFFLCPLMVALFLLGPHIQVLLVLIQHCPFT